MTDAWASRTLQGVMLGVTLCGVVIAGSTGYSKYVIRDPVLASFGPIAVSSLTMTLTHGSFSTTRG